MSGFTSPEERFIDLLGINGHTEESFAKVLKVNVRTVQRWKKKMKFSNDNELSLIAKQLNTTADYLVTGDTHFRLSITTREMQLIAFFRQLPTKLKAAFFVMISQFKS